MNKRSLISFSLLLVIIICAYLSYSPGMNAPFVFDDFQYIKNNSFIHIHDLSGSSISQVLQGPSFDRPISMISFALNYYYGGLETYGYHLVSWCIHISSSIILFFFIRNLLLLSNKNWPLQLSEPALNCWLPLSCVCIWTFHPLHIQSVTYLSQRMNSLAALFFLISIFMYHLGRTNNSRTRFLFFTLSLISALCALGSKQNTATIPLFIFAYEWIFFQKMDKKWIRKRIYWSIFLIIPAIGLYFLSDHRYWLVIDKDEYLKWLTSWRANAHYLASLFYPEPSLRNFDHDFEVSRSIWQPWTTFASILLMISIGIFTLYLYRIQPLLAFCLTWYLGNLVIESNYVRFEIYCDYRTYLPSMLFFLPLCYILFRKLQSTYIPFRICLLITMLLGFWTYQRNLVWADDVVFWKDNLEKSPNKARVWNNLGLAYQFREEYEKAIAHFNKATVLRPYYADAYSNIAFTYLQLGNINTAMNQYEIAYDLDPDNFSISNNYAGLLQVTGQHTKALSIYLKNLTRFPLHKQLHNNIGLLYKQTYEYELALKHLNKALDIDPYFLDANLNLGLFHSELKDFQLAEKYLKQALTIDPNNSRARELLGKLNLN